MLAPISSKWDLIRSELGVDIEVIEDLNKSDDLKLDQVIQKWVETKPTPTTWDNIIKVVNGPVVQSPEVASTIQEYLNQILCEQKQATIKSMQNIFYYIVMLSSQYTCCKCLEKLIFCLNLVQSY